MSRLHTALASARTRRAGRRAGLRAERAFRRALDSAPTVETAHEIAAISTRR